MGKRLKNDQKYAIFQNWLKTNPKVLNAQNKWVLHHFGGMLALKSGLGFFVSAPEVPFFGTSKRAILAGFKPILENRTFFIVFEAFSH